MESKIKQKKWFAAIGVALALLMAAVGIPVGISASADSVCNCGMGVYTISNNASVETVYYGHSASCAVYEESTYIHLGQDMNPNHGYYTHAGNSYSEIIVPVVGTNGASLPYYWMRPSTSPSASSYQSHYVLQPQAGYSSYAVVASIVDGYFSVSYERTVSVPAGWRRLACDFIYGGQVETVDISVENRPYSATVGGVTFSILILNNVAHVTTSNSFAAGNVSGQGSLVGAVSIARKI